VDWGEFPTEAVQAAIPVAGNMAIQLIQEWQT
jgi:hypothetical protein